VLDPVVLSLEQADSPNSARQVTIAAARNGTSGFPLPRVIVLIYETSPPISSTGRYAGRRQERWVQAIDSAKSPGSATRHFRKPTS
jgi:hypothetical protein